MTKNATPLQALAQAVIVTAEVMGHEITPVAAKAMALELAAYPQGPVLEALRRCTRELSGRLTLAAVLLRMEDGHLGVEEAWALCPRDESATVVWTDEIAAAYGVAAPLLDEGDQVAARMAFKQHYGEALAKARADRQPPRWFASLGHAAGARDAVLLDAVAKGRLHADHVAGLLSGNDQSNKRLAALVAEVAQARRLQS